MINYVRQNGAAIYFLLCMLVFLFVSYRGNVLAPFIDIPHIEVPVLPVYIVLLVTLLFVFLLCFVKESEFDLIAILLLIRIGLHFIPVLYVGMPSHFFVHLSVSVIGLSAYLIAKNFSQNLNSFNNVLRLTFIILAFQIVGEAFLGSQSFYGDAYFYKNDLVLPIGASNALASKVVPLFAVSFLCLKSKKIKLLFFLFALISVVLTKSRGGIVNFWIIFIFVMAWDGFFSFKMLAKCMIPLFCVFLFVYFLSNTEIGALAFSDSDSTVLERLDLWKNGVDLFFEHPLFGNGFYYTELAENPHNFLLDILMRSGLAGIAIFGMISSYIVFSVKNFFYDNFLRGCFLAALCMLFQGLVEIVLFSIIHDFILWTFLGIMMSRCKSLEIDPLNGGRCA